MSRITLITIIVIAGLLSACGAGPRQMPASTFSGATSVDQSVEVRAAGPLESLRQEAHLRYDFVALNGLATQTHRGALRMELGGVAAHKHTNGGWEDGWASSAGGDGETRYFEANKRSARLWFSPPSGSYERVVVRLKLASGQEEVGFHVNGTLAHTATVSTQWQEVSFEVPQELVKAGENELKLRFARAPKVDGRRQAGHVDWVHVLPTGVSLREHPTNLAVGTLSAGGVASPSLLAPTPQSHIYRLHVPERAPRLGFKIAAAKPGAELRLTAAADTVEGGRPQVLFERTVEDGAEDTWQEVVVDLSDYAGQVIELRFAALGAWPEGQVAGWAEPGLFTAALVDDAQPPMAERPAARNVLVFLIDTFRYDRLNTYHDDGIDQAPAMDRFAQDALVYTAAYNPANWTKPSVSSLLSSLYPSSHGARRPIDKFPADLTLLSEHFQDAGFQTASFVSNAYITPAYGFGQGWDHHRNYIDELPVDGMADSVVNDTIRWLDRHRDSDKRTFLYVHVIDPHAPYSPPKAFRKKFWDEPYDGKIVPYLTDRQMNRAQQRRLKVTDTDKRFVNALYDAEVAFTDHHFDRLMSALRERGLYDETAILVVSDHGEEFWDHERAGHGHTPYEELIHTPFMLRYPGRVPRGRKLPQVVSTVDVAPTLLELAGLPMWEGAEGNSLTDTFEGQGAPRPRAALFQGQSRFMGVRAGRYHLITYKDHRKLFDVLRDPQEQDDVLEARPIAHAYTRAVTGLMLGAQDKGRWWDCRDRASSREDIARQDAEIDEQTRKQLEALGYVEGLNMDDIVEPDSGDEQTSANHGHAH